MRACMVPNWDIIGLPGRSPEQMPQLVPGLVHELTKHAAGELHRHKPPSGKRLTDDASSSQRLWPTGEA